MTARYHRYIIGDKSNTGKDAPLRIEMGAIGLSGFKQELVGKLEPIARQEIPNGK